MTAFKKKIAYGLLVFAGVAFVAVTLVRATYDTSFLSLKTEAEGAPLVTLAPYETEPAEETPIPAETPPPAPHQNGGTDAYGIIEIPSIGVDAAIEYVGLTSAGAMATPKKLANTGWYKYGPEPGGPGSAVVAGHVENSLGFAGVFHELHAVAVGDEVYVTDADGARLRFVVRDIATYSAAAAPNDELFRSTGDPVLRLITCKRSVVDGKVRYDDRVVVTAVPA